MAALPRVSLATLKLRLLCAARISRGRRAVLALAPSFAAPSASTSAAYARREPMSTVLHRIVREHLATFLATVREERGKGLPRYVEEELRRYLRCGILAHGFLRVVCSKCRREIVVAYSCKCRGACPSCSARRRCDAAAHLVDHVLPDVPVRQWVLTAPHEARRVLALRPAGEDWGDADVAARQEEADGEEARRRVGVRRERRGDVARARRRRQRQRERGA